MLQISFPSSDTFFQFTSAIEGSTYIFQMQWMTRSECWYISLFDSNSNLLASNIKLVPNFPLFFQKVSLNFDGDFLVVPITTATTFTADNLASSWNLIYLTEDEISGG